MCVVVKFVLYPMITFSRIPLISNNGFGSNNACHNGLIKHSLLMRKVFWEWGYGCTVGWKEFIPYWKGVSVHRRCNDDDIKRLYFTIRQNLQFRIFMGIVKYDKYDDIFFPIILWNSRRWRFDAAKCATVAILFFLSHF